MTRKQWTITIAGSLATLGEILGKIAEVPPQLQAQIPQMFPEQIRGYVSLVCQTVAGIAFIYALIVAHKPPDVQPLPPPMGVSPIEGQKSKP